MTPFMSTRAVVFAVLLRPVHGIGHALMSFGTWLIYL